MRETTDRKVCGNQITLRLEGDRWTLLGAEDDFVAEHSFKWDMIRCYGDLGEAIGEAIWFAGDFEWLCFELSLEVPDDTSLDSITSMVRDSAPRGWRVVEVRGESDRCRISLPQVRE